MKGHFLFLIGAILTVCLFGVQKPVGAADADLEGVHKVVIVIEDLDKGAEDEQITRQMLEAARQGR